MLDIDTFLTYLYVMIDDLCKQSMPAERRHGPPASLTGSEVATLALFGQWRQFSSERDFYRYAERHLRGAFPGLPDRSQFNRLMRRHHATIVRCFVELARRLDTQPVYEALDGTAVATRDAKRRGLGWLPGLADIGWSNRVGWYEGFKVLLSVTPHGAITGFGFGAASTSELNLAETFFALRAHPDRRLATVGDHPASGVYVTDKGFEGLHRRRHWCDDYAATVVCATKRHSRHPWPRARRRWLAGLRQIVETVNGCLHSAFRLDHERPHSLDGFQARLAAKVALHNACIWLNQQLGRAPLAFADLVAW